MGNSNKFSHILVDTCNLIYLAQDPVLAKVLPKIKALFLKGKVTLIMSEVQQKEFENNIQRSLSQTTLNLKTALYFAKNLFNSDIDFKTVDPFKILDDQIKLVQELIHDGANHCDFKATDFSRKNAVERALNKKAPNHKGSGIGDCLLYEIFCEYVETYYNDLTTHNFYFITANKKDFSDSNKPSKPHPDLEIFKKDRVEYGLDFVSLINDLYDLKIDKEITDHNKEVSGMICPDCQGNLNFITVKNSHMGPIELHQCEKCSKIHTIPNYALDFEC